MEKLLRLLEERGLDTTLDLARACGLTAEEVSSKIKAWIEDGTIVGKPYLIDREKLGDNSVRAFIEVKISPERGGGFDRIAERIARFPQVTSCSLFSGGYDLMVEVKGDNLMEVAGFVSEKLSTMDGVLSTQSHFQLKVYKQNGVCFGIEEDTERLPVTP